MPGSPKTPADTREALERAWRELQRLREMLAPFVDLSPSKRPRKFFVEGEALRQGVAHLLTRQWAHMQRAIDACNAMTRYFAAGNGESRADYRQALIEFNCAIQRLRDAVPDDEQMRWLNDRIRK